MPDDPLPIPFTTARSSTSVSPSYQSKERSKLEEYLVDYPAKRIGSVLKSYIDFPENSRKVLRHAGEDYRLLLRHGRMDEASNEQLRRILEIGLIGADIASGGASTGLKGILKGNLGKVAKGTAKTSKAKGGTLNNLDNETMRKARPFNPAVMRSRANRPNELFLGGVMDAIKNNPKLVGTLAGAAAAPFTGGLSLQAGMALGSAAGGAASAIPGVGKDPQKGTMMPKAMMPPQMRRGRVGTPGYVGPGARGSYVAKGGAVRVSGRSHDQGGVRLPGNTEVEGGETIGQAQGGKHAFSKRLKVPGTDMTFADMHEKLIKRGASQDRINKLAQLQHQVAGRDESGMAQSGGPVDDELPRELPPEARGRGIPNPFGRRSIGMTGATHPVPGSDILQDIQGELTEEGNKIYSALEPYLNKASETAQAAEDRASSLINRLVGGENAFGGQVNEEDMNHLDSGGDINIKDSKKGTFTAAAKKRGMGVQEFARKVMNNKDQYSSAMVKKANFARNAKKWNNALGGPIGDEITAPDISNEEATRSHDTSVSVSRLLGAGVRDPKSIARKIASRTEEFTQNRQENTPRTIDPVRGDLSKEEYRKRREAEMERRRTGTHSDWFSVAGDETWEYKWEDGELYTRHKGKDEKIKVDLDKVDEDHAVFSKRPTMSSGGALHLLSGTSARGDQRIQDDRERNTAANGGNLTIGGNRKRIPANQLPDSVAPSTGFNLNPAQRLASRKAGGGQLAMQVLPQIMSMMGEGGQGGRQQQNPMSALFGRVPGQLMSQFGVGFEEGGQLQDGGDVSDKISRLVDEGYDQDQAVAIAKDMESRGELQGGGMLPDDVSNIPGLGNATGSTSSFFTDVLESAGVSGGDQGFFSQAAGVADKVLPYLPGAINAARGAFGDAEGVSIPRVNIPDRGIEAARNMETDINVRPQIGAANQAFRSIAADPNTSEARKQSAFTKLMQQRAGIRSQEQNQEAKLKNQRQQTLARLMGQQDRAEAEANQQAATREALSQQKAEAAKQNLLSSGITQISRARQRQKAAQQGMNRNVMGVLASMAGAPQTVREDMLQTILPFIEDDQTRNALQNSIGN